MPSLYPPDLPVQLTKPLISSDKVAWSPAVECCCRFPCSSKERPFYTLHPKGTLMSATSSDCHSCSSSRRDLTMAFLLQLLAPTTYHIFHVTENLAYPWMRPAVFCCLTGLTEDNFLAQTWPVAVQTVNSPQHWFMAGTLNFSIPLSLFS